MGMLGLIINCFLRFLTFCSFDLFIMVHVYLCLYLPPECTIDRHFVFSVPAFLTEPPLSPALLVAATNSTCKPQRVIADYALFKIPMDSCGARRVVRFNEWKGFVKFQTFQRDKMLEVLVLTLYCLIPFMEYIFKELAL